MCLQDKQQMCFSIANRISKVLVLYIYLLNLPSYIIIISNLQWLLISALGLGHNLTTHHLELKKHHTVILQL